jgi:hypothetical protein
MLKLLIDIEFGFFCSAQSLFTHVQGGVVRGIEFWSVATP